MLDKLATEAVHIIWDNNAPADWATSEEAGRTEEARMPNWFFIFPGRELCCFRNSIIV